MVQRCHNVCCHLALFICTWLWLMQKLLRVQYEEPICIVLSEVFDSRAFLCLYITYSSDCCLKTRFLSTVMTVTYPVPYSSFPSWALTCLCPLTSDLLNYRQDTCFVCFWPNNSWNGIMQHIMRIFFTILLVVLPFTASKDGSITEVTFVCTSHDS
jgi:hypothetical protein